MDPFVGEVRAFGFSYAPQNWAFCNGATLPIRQYSTLFSLIGTVFGGDGVSTFGLPNLVGNLAVGTGQSQGGTNWTMGQYSGAAGVTLTQQQLPAHNHGLAVSSNSATSASAVGNQLGLSSVAIGESSYDAAIYGSLTPLVQLSPQTLSSVGNNQAHSNQMPALAMNYCICVLGNYPYFP